jgi:hypothetical protein
LFYKVLFNTLLVIIQLYANYLKLNNHHLVVGAGDNEDIIYLFKDTNEENGYLQ